MEKLFGRFGPIDKFDVKRGPRGLYCFLEFRDPRDAADALHARHGYEFAGSRLSVEWVRGKGVVQPGSRGPPKRSEFRVRVEGLPAGTSWQDLKDFMRAAGDIGYADIVRSGVGVVEFTNRGDFEGALQRMDRATFKSRFGGEAVVVSVAADGEGGGGGGGGGGGRDRRARSRSRSRSRDRGRDRSADRGDRYRERGGERGGGHYEERAGGDHREEAPPPEPEGAGAGGDGDGAAGGQ